LVWLEIRTDIFVVFGWIWNLLTARSGNISLWLRNVWYVRPTALLSTAEESPFFQYWKRKCVSPPRFPICTHQFWL